MKNLVIKPSNSLKKRFSEIVDVYFAKTVDENGTTKLEKINEAFFGDKVYIVNDLENLFKFKIKIQIIRFLDNMPFSGTELFSVQHKGKETNTIVLENELSTEIILAPSDKTKYQAYEKKLKDKPMEFYIKVVAENMERKSVVCYNLKEHKYDYDNPPNFWYYKEGKQFVIKLKTDNTIYITRKWEKWTGQKGTSSTFGTFIFGDIEGFICEPYGPETTISNEDQRIPVGTYNLMWHTSGSFHKKKYVNKGFPELKNGFPKLFNEKVSADRGILIHSGTTGKDSLGCLLPGTKIHKKNEEVVSISGSIAKFYEIVTLIEEKGIENIKVVIKDEIQK